MPDPNGARFDDRYAGADSLHSDPFAGAPTGQSTGGTQLADVLVNYEEVFQALHIRYFQDHAALMQELAEYKAGFSQATGRMQAAEAKAAALEGEVEALMQENAELRAQLAPGRLSSPGRGPVGR